MKKIFSILLAAFATLAFSTALNAQVKAQTPAWQYTDNGNGVAYKKTIGTPDDNGVYTITLESFVMGAVTIEQKTKPADIVLVLDYSGSMRNPHYTYTYTEVNNTNGFTPNTINSNEYYVEYNGNYRRVTREGNNNNNRVVVFTEITDGKQHWLTPGGIVDSQPGGVGNNTTIWTGKLYTRTRNSDGSTKLDNLQRAVVQFVKNIQANNESLGLKEGEIGNRIALVLYDAANYTGTGRNTLIEVGNFTYTSDNRVLNYSGQNVLASRNQSGTNSREAMGLAREILDAVKGDVNRSRAVVMFTDGSPTHYSMSGETWGDDVSGDPNTFSRTIANGCIAHAYYIKNTIGAPVYSIGLFEYEEQNNLVKTYMEYTSSDFKDKTNLPTAAYGSDAFVDAFINFSEDKGDYCLIVDDNMSLDDIFEKVSQETGGSGNEQMSSAVTAVDVVSASFVLPGADDPEATDEDILKNVHVYLAPCTGVREETYTITTSEGQVTKHYLAFGTPEEQDFGGVGDAISVTLEAKDGTKRNAISVNGFDYSENWCGPETDLDTGETTYRGFKLMITIDIKMDPEATGGPNVETNGPGSGIYTIIDGKPVNVVEFISPTVSLPVNIYINKKGLQKGESGKFLIERALLPDDWEKPASYSEEAYGGLQWDPVTTVFVTQHENDPEDGAITKVVGLPSTKSVTNADTGVIEQKPFIYRVTEEEGWSWSYDSIALTPITTDQLVTNPFMFQNTKKDGIEYLIRHAESKVTNTFKVGGGATWDDSKENGR